MARPDNERREATRARSRCAGGRDDVANPIRRLVSAAARLMRMPPASVETTPRREGLLERAEIIGSESSRDRDYSPSGTRPVASGYCGERRRCPPSRGWTRVGFRMQKTCGSSRRFASRPKRDVATTRIAPEEMSGPVRVFRVLRARSAVSHPVEAVLSAMNAGAYKSTAGLSLVRHFGAISCRSSSGRSVSTSSDQ